MLLEKEIEKALREIVKAAGGIAYKFISPGQMGVPDRLIVWPGGRVDFVELKREGGSLTPLQEAQIAKLRALGANVTVVTGAKGLVAFFEDRGLVDQADRLRRKWRAELS